MTPKEAQKLSENIVKRYRGKVLAKVKGAEKELNARYSSMVAAISALVISEKPGAPLSKAIQAEVRQKLEGILPIIEAQVLGSAKLGNDAARAQSKAIFKNAFLEAFKSEKGAEAAAKARLSGRVYRDNVKLSSRLWRNHSELGRRLASDITDSIRTGKSISETADDLLRNHAQPALQVPQYIERITDKAKRIPEIGRAPLEKAIASHTRKLAGARDDITVRVQTEQFLKEIKVAQAEQVTGIVEQWTKDRMRKHARMIVRHETIEAYKDSYRASTEGQPWNKGYKWLLSDRHEKADICDVLANQNLYGLGPGGYPEDKVPPTPHLNDLCIQQAIVDVDHFKRIRAENRDEPPPPEPWKDEDVQSGSDWLADQSKKTQTEILGPTRQKIFQKAPGEVITSTGQIRKLKNIEQ